MDPPESSNLETLLGSAKSGDTSALGRILERYRHYLTLLARLRIGRRLQGKIDVEDLLQETFLEAHRAVGRLRAESEGELLVWLRKILSTTLSNQVRHYRKTKARDLDREQGLDAVLNDRAKRLPDRSLIDSGTSPSRHASRREQAVLLADALRILPEDYREVIILRQLEDLSFPEVARRMGRSEDSVKNLWVRALAKLRRALEHSS